MLGRSMTRSQTQGPSRSRGSVNLERTKTRASDRSRVEDAVTQGMLPAPSGDFARENIRVAARFRPVKHGFLKCDDIVIRESTAFAMNSEREFPLDKIFTDDSTQEEVFEWICQDTLADALKGINLTILAYGQTGSGKTHTMFGRLDSEENLGIIPRCCMMLFDLMENDEDGVEFTCSCSMLEIYREELNDLLSRQVVPLQIKENRNGGVFVEGLTHEYVTDPEQVLELIDLGNKAKVVASTKMNSESSRSHTIVVLDVVKKTRDGAALKGRLNLVDLAGSEKIKKTGAQGDTLEEAKKINLSLTALSHCIYALTKADPHVPFRSSKLTRFLQNSLGGNSKTSLVVACSSEAESFQETLSSLEFATRAKKIKNRVAANTELSPEALKDRLQALEFELHALQDYVREIDAFALHHGLQLPTPDGRLRLPSIDSSVRSSVSSFTSPSARPVSNRVAKRSMSALPYSEHNKSTEGILTDIDFEALQSPSDETGRDESSDRSSLKSRFNERLQLLALRTKTRITGLNSSEAKERASSLAQAPDLENDFMQRTPTKTDYQHNYDYHHQDNQQQHDMTPPSSKDNQQDTGSPPLSPSAEVVEQRAEIQALNAEIEAIYALVLTHEEEMARFLEEKNLEVSALRLQLEQQQQLSAFANAPSSEAPLAMDRLGTVDGVSKGLHNTSSGKQLMTNTTFRTMPTPRIRDNTKLPDQTTQHHDTVPEADESDRALSSAGLENGTVSIDAPGDISFVSVDEFKKVENQDEIDLEQSAQLPPENAGDAPKSESFLNLQRKLDEQNQALELQQGVLVKQQDVLAMLQRKVLELTRETQTLAQDKASLAEQLKEAQAKTGQLEHEIAFLRIHRRGSVVKLQGSQPHLQFSGETQTQMPHMFERARSDLGSFRTQSYRPMSPKIVPVVLPGKARRASTAKTPISDGDNLGLSPMKLNETQNNGNAMRHHSDPTPRTDETTTTTTTPTISLTATMSNLGEQEAGTEEEWSGDWAEHRGSVPKKLVCLCTQDPITDDSYCEYQTAPSMRWHPAKYADQVVRDLRAGGFQKYLKDCELASRDCAAAVRRIIRESPPVWLKDANALPLPAGDSHVCSLWFARTNTQTSGKLVGALEGEAREALWTIQKDILASMEAFENNSPNDFDSGLPEALPLASPRGSTQPRHPRSQSRKSTGSGLIGKQPDNHSHNNHNHGGSGVRASRQSATIARMPSTSSTHSKR